MFFCILGFFILKINLNCHFCSFSLYSLHFIYVTRTGLYIPGEVGLGILEWEHEFCALVVEVSAKNPSILLAVLQLFSVCFCHLRSLVIVISKSRYSSVAVSCWFAIV